MSDGENGTSGLQIKSGPLIVSAVLVGAGTLIVLTGLAVGGGYIASATRQWVREMETPPSELARQKWAQARAAAAAGAAAWQNGPQPGIPSQS